MWVKICGIRTMKAGLAAMEAGADAVGFVFAPSRRQVDPDRAQTLAMGLPGVARVGVFVDAPPAEVVRIARYVGLTHVQLHGDEPPEYLRELPLPAIKAVRLAGEADLEALLTYREAWGILIEPRVPGPFAGGAGLPLDPALARAARDRLRAEGYPGKVILAGGLTPETVCEAIRAVDPDGVDVSSGVEVRGEKNIDRIYDFLAAVRGCQR
ncbi:MAG: phosphoribosylanthranilate isomerase [Bacillota bacterium]